MIAAKLPLCHVPDRASMMLVLCASVLSGVACGNRGDLYLPDESVESAVLSTVEGKRPVAVPAAVPDSDAPLIYDESVEPTPASPGDTEDDDEEKEDKKKNTASDQSDGAQ